MEWTWVVTTTIPVLTFIAGLWWSRYDGDRRERRASRAAASAVFEQLQRDAHLELQALLGRLYMAARAAEAAGLQPQRRRRDLVAPWTGAP
jgi:hypothetical protein